MSKSVFFETLESGVTAHQAGRLDDALKSYRAALEIRPNDPEAASLCGLALLHSGKADEAISKLTREDPALKKAIEEAYVERILLGDTDPNSGNFVISKDANGNYKEARAQIEKALAVGIRDARFFLHAGEIALKQDDRAAAERYLRQAEGLRLEEAALRLASLNK